MNFILGLGVKSINEAYGTYCILDIYERTHMMFCLINGTLSPSPFH